MLIFKKYLQPYNILNIAIDINGNYNEYEIPPCDFTGVAWINTSPDSFENPIIREAVEESKNIWNTTIDAYKEDFLSTYKPSFAGLSTALTFAEIETHLLELIKNDAGS